MAVASASKRTEGTRTKRQLQLTTTRILYSGDCDPGAEAKSRFAKAQNIYGGGEQAREEQRKWEGVREDMLIGSPLRGFSLNPFFHLFSSPSCVQYIGRVRALTFCFRIISSSRDCELFDVWYAASSKMYTSTMSCLKDIVLTFHFPLPFSGVDVSWVCPVAS